ncbi:hypothetical protein B0T24DRAFT_623936 [Lasiosphaeria ovina]|uniref:Uncharacterized protein n=1 Tax=Lasiosphaeria ovina TaxID=92902 RepID=A0AAE0N8P9_9PEZI|nr:hypothetical protein B0T24DRAFT_623936 [Lasiosphaeria ovina]
MRRAMAVPLVPWCLRPALPVRTAALVLKRMDDVYLLRTENLSACAHLYSPTGVCKPENSSGQTHHIAHEKSGKLQCLRLFDQHCISRFGIYTRILQSPHTVVLRG